MLRTRIFAAATAALLALGMSFGGAGAAFAHHNAGHTGGGGGTTNTTDSPCSSDPLFDGGTKYNIGEEVDVSGSRSFEWGTLTWSEYQLVFTANPGWTVDLCVKGGSQEANSIRLDTGSVTIDRVQSISHFMWANPTFTAPVAVASIVTTPRDCDNPTGWNLTGASITNATWGTAVVSGSMISITATATGGALFAEGEGVSEDRTSKTFTAAYEEAGGDCELSAVVVPTVAYSEGCEGEGESAIQYANFTVTAADNVTYTYSVDGGDPVAVVFPSGEPTVTIDVPEVSEVEVTASAAAGFRLPDGYEPWSHSFDALAFCLTTNPTTTASAVIVAPDCLGNEGTIELTNGPGVVWTLNGEVVDGNTTHTVPTGTAVTLLASLESASYGWNDPDQQTEWQGVMEVDPGTGGEECLLDEDELPTLALTGANGITAWLGLFAVLATIVGMGIVIRRHQLMA